MSATAQPAVPETADLRKKRGSLRALQATNFFVADVQTGLGPFVAATLASAGWGPSRVGKVLTVAGIVTVLMQSPAGYLVDRIQRKRMLLLASTAVLAVGALLLAFSNAAPSVYASQVLIGASGAFFGPTLAAVTLGIVGTAFFDKQFGKNQGFNSAGNLFAAAVIAAVSHFFGNRAIFIGAALFTIPTAIATLRIRRDDIDPDLARGGDKQDKPAQGSGPSELLQDRVLLTFLFCAFLFHLANAAMLPQLGELLAHGAPRLAAPFMSGCIAITQCTIMLTAAWVGSLARRVGRKPLLLLGYAVLPIRAVLYTVFHAVPALLAVQVLDGVANSIFGVVSILLIADRTRGTGRFNLAQGTLATAIGLGAALSNTLGGYLIARFSFNTSFLALGAVAVLAVTLLLVALPQSTARTAQA